MLRSCLESILLGAGTGLRSCDPIARDYAACVNPGDYSKAVKEGRTPNPDVPEGLCDVCNLFGHPNFASRLRFKDLPVDEKTWHELLLQVRDGVAIDRETGTAAVSKKYDFEIVPAGVRFKLEITAENVQDDELGLLCVAVNALKEGYVCVGGSTSRGLGSVDLQITSFVDADAARLLAGNATSSTKVARLKARCRAALSAEIARRRA